MKRPILTLVFFTSWVGADDDISMIGETEITASSIADDVEETKGSQARITATDLLKRGSVSLPDALQREPGVSVPFDTAGVDTLVPFLQGGSKSVNIRGLEGNRISVLVDGIRQPEDFTSLSFEGAGGPGRIYFDPAVFAELNLFKSAAFAPDALGGAILGKTESPFTLLGPDLEGSIFKSNTSYASSNRSLNQRLATAWGNGELASSIVYSYRTGHEQENAGRLRADPSDFESHALVWKAVFRRGEWTFEPTVDYFSSNSFTDLNSIEIDSPLIGRTTESSNDSSRERIRFSLDSSYDPDTALGAFDLLKSKIYFQRSTSENLNIQKIENVRDRVNDIFYDTDIAGLTLAARKEFNTGDWEHSFAYTLNGSRSDIDSALLRTDFDQPTDVRPNIAPSIAWRGDLTIRDEIKKSNWTLTPAVRMEYYSVTPENTDEFLRSTRFTFINPETLERETRTVRATNYDNFSISPTLSLSYQASDEWEIYGSYAAATRNPTAEELNGVFVHPDNATINIPNPDLGEERSHSFELGVKRKTDRTSFHLSTYYNRYSDFIEGGVLVGQGEDGLDVLQTANLGSAEIYGVELKADWQFHDDWNLGGSFAWSEGRSDDGPINSIEPIKAVGYLAYQAPSESWGLELSGTFVGGKSASQISGVIDPTDSYFLLDLTGYYEISENSRIRAGVKNILDESYVLWSRGNRGSGHNGGGTNSRDTQPGVNGFLSFEMEF